MTQVSKQKPETPKEAACCSSNLSSCLDAHFFKALGDPTRLNLLNCLALCGRPCSVSEIAECCSVDFSVVSRHLSLLADAGILDSRKDGRTVFYEVKYAALSGMLRALANEFEKCAPTSGRLKVRCE